MKKTANIAVFASGNGSNAENLALHFGSHPLGKISLLVTNRESAGVIPKMKKLGIPTFVFSNSEIQQGHALNDFLLKNNIDIILLAGFLRKVPKVILASFSDRILNIHPSLLPKHGGQGMYGLRVHEAVIRDGDKESGATVHLVNEEYDKGRIILSECCPVLIGDSAETLASRIHSIEYRIFPKAVEAFIAQLKS